jgi:hypothetical protein
MRTTITLEPDVAVLLRRAMRARRESLKRVINEALRAGLAPPTPKAREASPAYQTRVHDTGACLIDSLDCVAEALAVAEGEDHR